MHKSLKRDNHLAPIAGVSGGLQRAERAGMGGREDSEWLLDPPKTEMNFDAGLFAPNKTDRESHER